MLYYFLVALLFLPFAYVLTRKLIVDDKKPLEFVEVFFCLGIGTCMAALWPIFLVLGVCTFIVSECGKKAHKVH